MKGRTLLYLLTSLVIFSDVLHAQEDYMKQAADAKSRRDYASACALYEKAIASGQNAWYDLASIYEYQLDDPVKAVVWFRRGAGEGSCVYCQGCLADALKDGHGCDRDLAEARFWYSKAAAQWEASGQYEYALQFYTSAAKLGDVAAMRRVAQMYEQGTGCTANPKISRQWLDAASGMEMKQKAAAPEPSDAPVRETEPDTSSADTPQSRRSEADARPIRDDLYSVFAKNYVETKINQWQQKDEFEKTETWKSRVEKGRDSLIAVFTSSAERLYVAQQSSRWSFEPGETLTLGLYDSDNEVFLITHPHFGNMLLPVPIDRAPEFKMDWMNQLVTPNFYIRGDTLAVATLRFENPRTNDTFTYSDTRSLSYSAAEINYNFAELDFTPAGSRNRSAGSQRISSGVITIGGSDVDVNIPEVRGTPNDRTFAVVIGNENYQTEAAVRFAANDAAATGQYFIKTLGIPENHIHVVTDATLNNMRRELNWIETVSRSYKGEATVIFYYSGHGIPDEANRSAYLLPIDGYGMDVTTGYSLDDIYRGLTGCDARQAIVMLDACFSGASRDGGMMHAARGVAIKAETSPTQSFSDLIVLSAATGDETAYPYIAGEHGMFTYFLLSKLSQTKGSVKLGELFDYIHEQVSRKSIVENGKSQTPTFHVSEGLRPSWRNITLR